MSTLSVPLPANLQKFVEKMVKTGRAANKADVVRKALMRMAEDELVEAVLKSQQEAREGKILYGSVRDLVRKI